MNLGKIKKSAITQARREVDTSEVTGDTPMAKVRSYHRILGRAYCDILRAEIGDEAFDTLQRRNRHGVRGLML